MNQIIKGYYPTFEQYQSLRNQTMDLLDDGDLAFQIGGNPTLGELCKEIGEVEQSYIDSFKTFTQDFSYRSDNPAHATSVEALKSWYAELDAGLRTAIEALTDEDLQNKMIERGFQLPPHIQLTVYNEALLIFYGKTSVYLKAMGKERPQQWKDWIA